MLDGDCAVELEEMLDVVVSVLLADDDGTTLLLADVDAACELDELAVCSRAPHTPFLTGAPTDFFR